MAVGSTGMKWLHLLESEFDKAYVDLDLLLARIDYEQRDLMKACYKKMEAMSAAFAQLAHKSQVVFASNMDFEEELTAVRQELVEAEASRAALQKEIQHLLLQLHSAELKVSAQMGHAEESEAIKQRLENEMEQYKSTVYKETLHETQVRHLKKENDLLKQLTVALESEAFGARLASKYIAKELAGRIQLLQLCELRGLCYDTQWFQIEAQTCLQRHKSLIRACIGRKGEDCKLTLPPGHDCQMHKKKQGVGNIRYVTVVNGENEDLGIRIIGGKEFGVPIIILEIDPNSPVCGKLFVGDAILSVNGIDLGKMEHTDAARIISSQKGEITLEVVFVAPDEEWDRDGENGNFKFSYQFYDCQTTKELCNTMNKKLTDCGTDPIDPETLCDEKGTDCESEGNANVCTSLCNTDCLNAENCLKMTNPLEDQNSYRRFLDAIVPENCYWEENDSPENQT